jgi:predicted ATPase with chaperone activity
LQKGNATVRLWLARAPQSGVQRNRGAHHNLARYAARVSGPILDRLDLQIEVTALASNELMAAAAGERSADVRARVLAAREVQRARGWLNAQRPAPLLREHCGLDAPGRQLVADAIDRGGMSARAVHRAVRVARTIADVHGEERVGVLRLAEALQYRAYAHFGHRERSDRSIVNSQIGIVNTERRVRGRSGATLGCQASS